MAPTLATLRAAAYRTLAPQPDLQTALNQMGFLQADPIRAPARAQDLTLMQRVPGYRAGELEARYAELEVEEDYFPNYGFVSRPVRGLLHPRAPRAARIEHDAPGLMERVLAHTQHTGELHPRMAGEVFGRTRVANNWGGGSNATTRALEALHHAGHLRVVRREAGIKVFGPATVPANVLTQAERLRALVMVLARLYAPASEPGLRLLVGLSHYGMPGLLAELRAELKAAVNDGALTSAKVDGLSYLWPEGTELDSMSAATSASGVRIVGPFDPLIWDRRRFEHLHGWTYRFEAYTPPARRVMGYYALPLFLADKAVGWANLSVKGGELVSDIGLIPGLRRTAAFEKGLKAELERYRRFLGLVI
ncbi:crosslink repair DNA glycosylase YcaQ family protein [Deinococcus sp.]|uniref:DNA glycosylase AlkZ-like family protein n=1 Tax=Deinococcus sp. TaxID=47478 RepID=UPI0025DB607E|nr:crosslink repair DNA glycosylase YcaQ family protein [Deinococcus sp.]